MNPNISLKRISLNLALLLLALPAAMAQTVSEEDPPMTCGNRLLAGIICTGDYCDNMTRVCGETAQRILNFDWTGFVSEERPNTKSCRVPADSRAPGFITGFACNGRYCDNVALECASLVEFEPNTDPAVCSRTPWVSEETGRFEFPSGFFAVEMECSGDFCDNKRFLLCPMKRREVVD